MPDEAHLEQTAAGLAPAAGGWFTVNVRDAAWVRSEKSRAGCVFEGDGAPLAQIGYTLWVLQPRTPSGLYHRETEQEDFLVLAGECLLLVEEQERRLHAGGSSTVRRARRTCSWAPATGPAPSSWPAPAARAPA